MSFGLLPQVFGCWSASISVSRRGGGKLSGRRTIVQLYGPQSTHGGPVIVFSFSVGPFMHSFVCSGMQRGRWEKGERQMGCFRLNLQRIQHAGTCSAFVRGNRCRDIYSILTSGWFLDLPQKYSCDLSTGTTAFDLYSRWSYTGGKPISDHRYIYFFTFPDIFVLLVTACAVLGMADRLSSRGGSFWNLDAGRTHVSSLECRELQVYRYCKPFQRAFCLSWVHSPTSGHTDNPGFFFFARPSPILGSYPACLLGVQDCIFRTRDIYPKIQEI